MGSPTNEAEQPYEGFWNRIILRKTLASPAGVLLVPAILFVTLFACLALWTVWLTGTDIDHFRKIWELLAAIGSTLAGVGTFFIALTLGASFLTLAAQSEQLALQKREVEQSRIELAKAAETQAATLRLLETESRSMLLTAKIHSLTSRLQGYDEQIHMVKAMNPIPDKGYLEVLDDVRRMRNEQDKLYRQLDRILDDLRIGTKADVPPEGTYSDPFAAPDNRAN
jgi:hypothetical protein